VPQIFRNGKNQLNGNMQRNYELLLGWKMVTAIMETITLLYNKHQRQNLRLRMKKVF